MECGSRKRQIIDAAFALSGESEGWSLSEVAARVGVSKTALYRHFRNKEEIQEAMKSEFRDGLLDVIDNAVGNDDFRLRLRAFFRDHDGYLGFFMARLFADDAFDQEIFSELEERSKRVSDFRAAVATVDPERQEKILAGVLKSVVSVILASAREPGIEGLQEELLGVAARGLPSLRLPASERLDALEREAKIRPEELAGENRLFDAIAGSIREHGVGGTTIERIAERMGMAKSSLYFYYPNKAEMLAELVHAETSAIVRLCMVRAAAGKTLAEQLYSVMAVQNEYLLAKPDLLPVFGWIRFETLKENHRGPPPDHDTDAISDAFRVGDLFPEDTPESRTRMLALVKWASILATSAVIQGVRKGNSPATNRRIIRYVFESMLVGDRAFQEALPAAVQ